MRLLSKPQLLLLQLLGKGAGWFCPSEFRDSWTQERGRTQRAGGTSKNTPRARRALRLSALNCYLASRLLLLLLPETAPPNVALAQRLRLVRLNPGSRRGGGEGSGGVRRLEESACSASGRCGFGRGAPGGRQVGRSVGRSRFALGFLYSDFAFLGSVYWKCSCRCL